MIPQRFFQTFNFIPTPYCKLNNSDSSVLKESVHLGYFFPYRRESSQLSFIIQNEISVFVPDFHNLKVRNVGIRKQRL